MIKKIKNIKKFNKNKIKIYIKIECYIKKNELKNKINNNQNVM